MTDTAGTTTRDRLLTAAADLLAEPRTRDVSTRAICERAGVQAPTLYHHFGNKQGLLDAVVTDRFTRHMHTLPSDDPVSALRESWNHHVHFGLANPSYEIRTDALIPAAEAHLTTLLNDIARQGRLRVAPETAATQLAAATVGTTLSLLAAGGTPNFAWSDQLRDTLLATLLTDATAARPTEGDLPAMAVGFLAQLDKEPGPFTEGERTLLREWLHRTAAH